jgi:hypothetical protein
MSVARHEVPGKRLPKEPSRRVRYERALLIPEIVLVESASRRMFELLFDVMDPVPEHMDFLCFHIQTCHFNTAITKSKCAHLQESDRTLRDGSFWGGTFQALRARLRSHCPSGTKAIRLRESLIKLALMGLKPRGLNTYSPFGAQRAAGAACGLRAPEF